MTIFADPLDERPSLSDPGLRLDRSRTRDGTTTARVVDGSDRELGSIMVFAEAHGDAFYGHRSAGDDRYCYGSKLEVDPAARGRGLGQELIRVARCVAFEEGGRGLKSLVAPDNAVSLRCHEVAGFHPPDEELTGLRLGNRVLWLTARSVRS